MKINKLVLKNFKRFPNKTILLQDGMNVVIGKNETGKSTIVEAILVALYENPESKAIALKKYYSWNSDKGFEIEMEFEANNKKYLLIKDFVKREAKLILPDGKTISNIDLIDKYLISELKFPPKSVYQNSGFIKQDEIIKLDYDGEFKNSVQNLVVEGDEKIDISNILKTLDKKITYLNKGSKGNMVNPGPIMSLTNTIKEKELKLRQLESRWDSILISQQKLEKTTGEKDILKNKIESGKNFLQKIKAYNQLSKDLNDLNTQCEKIENIELEYKSNQRLISEKNLFIKANFKEFLEEDFEVLEENINSLLAQEKVLSQVEVKDKSEEKIKSSYKDFILEALILLVFIIVSVIVRDYIPIIIGILIALGVYFYERQKKQIKPVKNKSLDINPLENVESQLNEICEEFKVADITVLQNKLKDYKGLLAEINSLNTNSRIILGKLSIDDLVQNKRIILRKIGILEEKLKDTNIEGKKYSDEEISDYEFKLEKLESKFDSLKDDNIALNAQIKSSDISLESINIEKEELEEKKEELNKLNGELIIYRLVKESIESSYKGTVKDSKSVIEKIVNDNIENATQGRYTKIQLTDDFDLKVFSVEKNDFVSCKELSRGTIDQIYLLTRLSFAQVLTGGQNIPIILDDPFVNFDKDRLSSFKEILINYSKKYQLILFTHNDFYSDWGELIKM